MGCFWSFCILSVICPHCACMQLFLVSCSCFVFCYLGRHLSRCSKGSQVPGSSLFQEGRARAGHSEIKLLSGSCSENIFGYDSWPLESARSTLTRSLLRGLPRQGRSKLASDYDCLSPKETFKEAELFNACFRCSHRRWGKRDSSRTGLARLACSARASPDC